MIFKKNKNRRCILFNIKTYYKAIVIHTNMTVKLTEVKDCSLKKKSKIKKS
jgi:hypothetical protein